MELASELQILNYLSFSNIELVFDGVLAIDGKGSLNDLNELENNNLNQIKLIVYVDDAKYTQKILVIGSGFVCKI